jgi:putative hydrolase of the HAD superfamily
MKWFAIVPYRAVIFDLFGTLVDFSADEHERILAEMSAALEIPETDAAPRWQQAYQRQELGEPVEESIAWICRSFGVKPGAEQTLQAARLWTDFQRKLLHSPREDALGTLTELRTAGYRIGLISNCPAEVPVLWEGSPLASLIDVAVFSCKCGMLKPDPRIYSAVCERLHVEPSQCVFVGDGGSDELRGAAAVGMYAVLCAPETSSFSDEHAQREVLWSGCRISHLSDLPLLIQSDH